MRTSNARAPFGRRAYRNVSGTPLATQLRAECPSDAVPTPWEWKPTPDAGSKAALDAMAAALNVDQEEHAARARAAYVRDIEEKFSCVRGATLSPMFMAALDDLNWAHLTRRPVAPEHVGRLNERLQAVARVALTEEEVACATALFRSYE